MNLLILIFVLFAHFFLPNFMISNSQLVLAHCCNSRTDSGEAKVKSHASSETQPNQAALLLDTMPLQPRSQPHQCVRGNTVYLATVSACTAPGPPQESLVRNETRISLPAKPSPNLDSAGPHGPPCCGRLRQSLDMNTESLVAQLELQCSALDHCATWEFIPAYQCLYR